MRIDFFPAVTAGFPTVEQHTLWFEDKPHPLQGLFSSECWPLDCKLISFCLGLLFCMSRKPYYDWYSNNSHRLMVVTLWSDISTIAYVPNSFILPSAPGESNIWDLTLLSTIHQGVLLIVTPIAFFLRHSFSNLSTTLSSKLLVFLDLRAPVPLSVCVGIPDPLVFPIVGPWDPRSFYRLLSV